VGWRAWQLQRRRAAVIMPGMLLLLLAGAAPGVAASAARPLPRWAWNRSMDAQLPVGWFGSNTSGFENPAQLDAISRYDLSIFGWQAFLEATNYSREAEQLVLQARRVKARDPPMPVAIYLDAELAEPFQDAVLHAMRDPSMRDFFLRDHAGTPIPCNVFCRSMPGISKTDPRCLAYYWNWFNNSAIDYYLEQYVEPIVAMEGFDAVFFDGADEWMMQRSHTWAVASNVGTNTTIAKALEVMMDVRVRTTQLLHKYGKYPIISEHLCVCQTPHSVVASLCLPACNDRQSRTMLAGETRAAQSMSTSPAGWKASAISATSSSLRPRRSILSSSSTKHSVGPRAATCRSCAGS
jgi:hypothetical protein